MSKVFILADPHWNHSGIRFVPGRKERCGNMTLHEHDEFLIDNWNSVVGNRDVVYLLGDLGFDKPSGYLAGAIFPRLAGRIKVVAGNHDTAESLHYFRDVHGVIVKTIAGYRCVMTHIPIHPQEMWWDFNLHGHLHSNTIKKHANIKEHRFAGPADPRYICVSCEHMNYTPQLITDVIHKRTASYDPKKK